MDDELETVEHHGRNEAPLGDGISAPVPERIGRYHIERLLGRGGFGLVYLAYDEQLQRLVAIKVPHPKLVAQATDAEAYLVEARTVANLDHPNIVPVHDVGSTEQFPCYIVSKYVDGADLFTRLKQSRLSLHKAVELVATVAEALHYAHKQGLVHRDIKPTNILLDKSDKPYIVDFGLALREQEVGEGPRYVGTPAYMSPEQARGEGHRVDGRSDIFSLGVVLYELLTNRHPFRGESLEILLTNIASLEPRPPRQIDNAIPKELERICLKALSKRVSERYAAATDMSDDLRHFLTDKNVDRPSATMNIPRVAIAATASSSVAPSTLPAVLSTDARRLKIVPKGLRSFDEHDADFFLELLPGPRDRNGLPDSIRFWKTRIEEKDASKTFPVGLIYGPSGCGKSSLVKAGLLPRLSEDVVAVYVEATAEETVTRLQIGLRKRCPDLPVFPSLKETLAAVRRGQGIPSGKKLLIVLDQFEQWLHARKEEEGKELVQALRQCDGERVQCLVLVRDDFWLAVSRFLRDLEIRLVEGQNSSLIDLFDLDHARRVLAAIGCAFGKLPESPNAMAKEQKEFLNQAVSDLAQEGKVISVRLALFAEMIKDKSWTLATLKEMGGAEGVGLTFLEETFSASTAPPEHRYHQGAARAVLKSLLPQAGTDIKGQMRSRQELLDASGYASRKSDFDDLIRILDSEIRLITPAEQAGSEEPSQATVQQGARYYQLTHDYLVPCIRDWLSRKQKESRVGRAELLLEDFAEVWNVPREHRQLPSLLQWVNIRLLTRAKDWTRPQQKMMKEAGRYHGLRILFAAVFLGLVGWGSYEAFGRLRAGALRDQLLNADTKNVPNIVEELSHYRRWVDPLLRDAYQEAEARKQPGSRAQLHVSMALLPVDPGQTEYLYERLLDATPQEISILCEVLAPHQDELLEKLWAVVEHPPQGKEHRRLRAACALAKYDPENGRWATVAEPVVDDFVSVAPTYLERWMDSLKPVRRKLQTALETVFRDANRTETKRSLATSILADYLADRPQELAELLMNADEKQFPILYDRLQEHKRSAQTVLDAELDLK